MSAESVTRDRPLKEGKRTVASDMASVNNAPTRTMQQ
jgi:hypothetical protein